MSHGTLLLRGAGHSSATIMVHFCCWVLATAVPQSWDTSAAGCWGQQWRNHETLLLQSAADSSGVHQSWDTSAAGCWGQQCVHQSWDTSAAGCWGQQWRGTFNSVVRNEGKVLYFAMSSTANCWTVPSLLKWPALHSDSFWFPPHHGQWMDYRFRIRLTRKFIHCFQELRPWGKLGSSFVKAIWTSLFRVHSLLLAFFCLPSYLFSLFPCSSVVDNIVPGFTFL